MAGMPEDVSHTKQALARGYTLLALDPNSPDLCWSSSAKGSYVNDQPDVSAGGRERAGGGDGMWMQAAGGPQQGVGSCLCACVYKGAPIVHQPGKLAESKAGSTPCVRSRLRHLSAGLPAQVQPVWHRAHFSLSLGRLGPLLRMLPQVIATVSQFLKDHGLEGKPLFFAGASSGGTIALKLPATLFSQNSRLRIDGIIAGEPVWRQGQPAGLAHCLSLPSFWMHRMYTCRLQRHMPHSCRPSIICAEVSTGGGTPDAFGAADSQGRLRWPGFPPTFFVTMEASRGPMLHDFWQGRVYQQPQPWYLASGFQLQHSLAGMLAAAEGHRRPEGGARHRRLLQQQGHCLGHGGGEARRSPPCTHPPSGFICIATACGERLVFWTRVQRAPGHPSHQAYPKQAVLLDFPTPVEPGPT